MSKKIYKKFLSGKFHKILKLFFKVLISPLFYPYIFSLTFHWLLTGQQIEYVKEEEEKYLSREEFESISEKDKIIFKAFETLPEERKRDIEGYIKVSLNTTDLEEFIKKEKKV
ncbi:MAG: helix-turn-helix domain-containing protein [Thermoanaerobacter thermocopriae]|nr:MAG: helix-turn-helix domain-containing protein [Thermoanaerobacter thermocopriae]